MDRNRYIGSSDARDILSGNWDKLYRLKMGLLEREDLSDSFPVQLGLLTEDFHLDWSIRRLNEERGSAFQYSKFADEAKKTQHEATFTPEGSFNAPLLGSHPDAILRSPDAQIFPMEVKHTGRFKNADEAADFYMPQLQHHLLCWDADLLMFSVICGNSEPERIFVGASKEWHDHYIERCDRFWGHIKSETPPAPAFFDEAKQAKPIVPTKVSDTVPRNGFKRRDLANSNQAPALIERFIETKEAAKHHEDVKNELKAMMADDENELYHPKIVLKRDKRGAIRFTLKEDAA